MTLEELLTKTVEFAKQIFDGDDQIIPTWFGETRGGEMVCISTPFDSEMSKNLSVMAVKKLFKEREVVRYIFMSEAWVASRPTAEAARGVVPSEDPDRKEIVMFNGEGDGQRVHAFMPIIRPEDGEATLGEITGRDFTNLQGRMTGILYEGSIIN